MNLPNEKCPACGEMMYYVPGEEDDDYYFCLPCTTTIPVKFYNNLIHRLKREWDFGYEVGFEHGYESIEPLEENWRKRNEPNFRS
jgi:hypothetical protein